MRKVNETQNTGRKEIIKIRVKIDGAKTHKKNHREAIKSQTSSRRESIKLINLESDQSGKDKNYTEQK